ncbi:MAG TPA: class I poly(R)-hydroxyalkanoic acid synthase, partial [Sphingomicrobium sp.]
MTDDTTSGSTTGIPTLEDWQHWTWVMGRAQQMLMESWADSLKQGEPAATAPPAWGAFPPAFGWGGATQGQAMDPAALMSAGAQAWAQGLEAWGKMLGVDPESKAEARDRRFAAPEWHNNPVFDTIRKTYLALSDKLLGTADQIEGLDADTRHKLNFAVKGFVDAMSPSNFALTNPEVLTRTIETRGENLL